MFSVHATPEFLKEIKRWPPDEKKEAEKMLNHLAEDPHHGEPLHFPFLREKHVREKRMYYLLYEDLKLVLVVGASGKKDQEKRIQEIVSRVHELRKVAEGLAGSG